MIEQGLVMLISADPDVQALAPNGGGFNTQLPKDQALPSWTYMVLGGPSDYTLQAGDFSYTRVEFTAYGTTKAETIKLGAAIHEVIQNFRGALPDDDATLVNSCLRDGGPRDVPFDEVKRSFRRTTEYLVWFYQ